MSKPSVRGAHANPRQHETEKCPECKGIGRWACTSSDGHARCPWNDRKKFMRLQDFPHVAERFRMVDERWVHHQEMRNVRGGTIILRKADVSHGHLCLTCMGSGHLTKKEYAAWLGRKLRGA